MSNVPAVGTYKSPDKNFTLKISSANPSNGVITGVYSANYSPIGAFSVEGNVGTYGWVFSKGQGKDGVEFYTDKKVVVERWPKEWSRKF